MKNAMRRFTSGILQRILSVLAQIRFAGCNVNHQEFAIVGLFIALTIAFLVNGFRRIRNGARICQCHARALCCCFSQCEFTPIALHFHLVWPNKRD